MTALDRLVRSLYALTLEIEDEWDRFRPLALEQVCRALGLPVAAWLTLVEDRTGPSEFTTYPENVALDLKQLRELDFGKGRTLNLTKSQALAGSRQSVAVLYPHHDTRLQSVVAFGFAEHKSPVEDAQRTVCHLVESSVLALRQYIQRDERLYRMGRNNRGASAVVDAGGTVYAASRRFREIVGAQLGRADLNQLPFTLPEEAFTEQGLFSHGPLRFRAARLRAGLFQIYARPTQPLDELSPREQEIARALGAGKTFKSVAKECGIAVSTVANHASRIYRKLGVYRREDLVQLVRRPSKR